MASTFPTRLADDYVPPAYLHRDEERSSRPSDPPPPNGDAVRLIAFRSGRHVLAVTALQDVDATRRDPA